MLPTSEPTASMLIQLFPAVPTEQPDETSFAKKHCQAGQALSPPLPQGCCPTLAKPFAAQCHSSTSRTMPLSLAREHSLWARDSRLCLSGQECPERWHARHYRSVHSVCSSSVCQSSVCQRTPWVWVLTRFPLSVQHPSTGQLHQAAPAVLALLPLPPSM